MASNTVTTPPDDWFTPPGTVRISTSALNLARAFHVQAAQTQPDEEWVISFDWSDSRRIREKGTNNWQEVGAGIDLTAYERERVKNEFTEVFEDLRVAIKIPRNVWEASAERLIDSDETAFSGLTLR